jgi:phosphoglycolate phosphatase-like HAD superfamily hydrolase
LEIAVELDEVLGDTRPLWLAWLDDLARRSRIDLAGLPEDRGAAAAELNRRAGNWQAQLERFAEDHAPVYLRPNAEVSAALRQLRAAGASIVAVTDAPEPLARVALSHLAARLVDGVATEAPPDAAFVRTRDELLVQSEAWKARR